MSKRSVITIVCILSILTLELEFLQTRIFSVVLWYNFVYLVITMALLGFAASGTILQISSRLKKMEHSHFYFLCLFGFSISAYVSSKFSSFPMDWEKITSLFTFNPGMNAMVRLVSSYTLCMLPYFFAGLTIGGSFVRFPRDTGILYCANLFGSGLGCVLFIVAITNLGAPQLLLLTSFIPLFFLIYLAKNKKSLLAIIIPWFLFLSFCMALPDSSKTKKILPEPHKQFWSLFSNAFGIEYEEWNPISRIDVVSEINNPKDKRILMDGDAQALLWGTQQIKSLIEEGVSDRNVPYLMLGRKPTRTLIIGAGGGLDVVIASLKGSATIDAVEINPTTARIVTSKKYSPFINDIFLASNVHLFIEDGRSFVKRTKNRYDVIMLSATDSFLALSTGAYTLSDAYLYTREALQEYLSHLTDNGMVHIGRFHFKKKPRETLRNFATALEACRNLGYKDPLAHVIVIGGNNWVDVITKKTPYTHEELVRLQHFCSQYSSYLSIYFPASLESLNDLKIPLSPFIELAEHFAKGTEKIFYDQYFYKVTPVSDDSPFFYQCDKGDFAQSRPISEKVFFNDAPLEALTSHLILPLLLLHSSLLSFVLIILPLLLRKRDSAISPYRFFTVIYFLSIGLAFMFFEMGIIQKFVLFLGSPIYSLAIVIPTILIGAGIGSLVSYWIKNNLKLYIIGSTFLLSCFIFLLLYFISDISNLFLMQPLCVRIITVIITLMPIAFLMGFPFPLAIKSISRLSSESVPWAWAINGAASVIASILTVMLAMHYGFKTVLILAGWGYLLSALATLLWLHDKK